MAAAEGEGEYMEGEEGDYNEEEDYNEGEEEGGEYMMGEQYMGEEYNNMGEKKDQLETGRQGGYAYI